MPSRLEANLASLGVATERRHLAMLNRGIEKESLRVKPSGSLSQMPHPAAIGSALTHPQITTDFSEAQLELITGVHHDADACLAELIDIHKFVYRHIDDELLWAASMPCMLTQEDAIPVGRYGSSNVGKAKTVYRLGLGARYGRFMQTISGVHYNFSMPDAVWPVLAAVRNEPANQATRTAAYFDLIRNFRRHSWLLIYLFGASPSICKSFVKHHPHNLECFDEGSLFLPYATSLRMGRLGYQSEAQASLHVSFNSLADYARSLQAALRTPYPEYQRIGIKVNGEYRQLTDSLLQIENEFYGTIRPKRPAKDGGRTLTALLNHGVDYVEVRSLDLDPFQPAGVDVSTMRFLDIFLLHCLLSDSAPDSKAEAAEVKANQLTIVEEGRRPGLDLRRAGSSVRFETWAHQILDECRPIAELLDRATGTTLYTGAWTQQKTRVVDPSTTPSARVLDEMRSEGLPFFRFAMNQSIAHKAWCAARPLPPDRVASFEASARQSLVRQREIEAADRIDFDTYLAHYLRAPEPDKAP